MRLPKTLAYVTFQCALAGVIACSGNVEGPADASADATGHDSAAACDGAVSYCGSGSCPSQGAFYCMNGCPPGCEPFA